MLTPTLDPTPKYNSIQCNRLSEFSLTPISKPQTVSPTRSLLASLTVESQNVLGGSLPDDDEIDHNKAHTIQPWLPLPSTTNVSSEINILGDEDLQHRLRTLCMVDDVRLIW